jgi:DNA polymerase III gamma/tau subunit
MLAEMAEGGMRDALSRLDQLIAFAGEKAKAEDAERVFGLVGRKRLMTLLEQLSSGDAKAGILFAEQVFDSGKDVAEVLAALVALTRQLLMVQAGGGDSAGIDVAADELPELKRVAARFGLMGLVYLAELLTECRQRVRRAAFPRVVVETTFVKLAMLGRLESLEELAARLNEAADAPIVATAPKLTEEAPVSATRNVSSNDSDIRSESPVTAPPKTRPTTEAEHKALAELKKKFRAH